MAKLGRMALFWRAFFLTLVFGSTAGAADEAESNLWQITLAANTADCYFKYLSQYPAGDYVDQAVSALVRLGAVNARGTTTSPIELNPVCIASQTGDLSPVVNSDPVGIPRSLY